MMETGQRGVSSRVVRRGVRHVFCCEMYPRHLVVRSMATMVVVVMMATMMVKVVVTSASSRLR